MGDAADDLRESEEENPEFWQLWRRLVGERQEQLELEKETWVCDWCGEEFGDDELKYYPGQSEVICDDCATAGGHVIL